MQKTSANPEINLFRALEVFMAVGETGQVTVAAKALGMTQSAASQHLKKLEQSFGVALFDRSSRPLEVTHAGAALQRRAYRILNEVEDMKLELRHLQSSSLPVLRIGMLASIATSLTPDLYDLVEQELKVPELVLSAGLANDHQTALNGRKIDIAVTSDPQFDVSDYQVIPVLEEPFFLVLPEAYDGPENDIHEITRRLKLVRFSSDAPVGRRTEQHLQRCRVDVGRSMEADRASMVVAGVITGKCFAILTPTLLIDAVAEGMALKIRRLPIPGFKRSVQVIARDGELGDIPEAVAKTCARQLRHQFETRFGPLPEPVTYLA